MMELLAAMGSTESTIDTISILFFGGFGVFCAVMVIAANLLKDHPSCKPEESPEDRSLEADIMRQIAECRPSVPSKPKTVKQCKNPECNREVSYKKISGDYCAYCHIEQTPIPTSPEDTLPKHPIKAIPAEVRDNG